MKSSLQQVMDSPTAGVFAPLVGHIPLSIVFMIMKNGMEL